MSSWGNSELKSFAKEEERDKRLMIINDHG